MNLRHRVSHCAAVFATLTTLAFAGQASAQGYTEINQAVVDAAGGLPYVITEPGLYRLTGNITRPNVATNTPMIRIDSDSVEVDLNGFTLLGLGVCGRNAATGQITCNGHLPGSGIQSSGFQNVTVRDGTVRGFFNGVVVSGPNSRIENVNAIQNAFDGVNAIGDAAFVTEVTAYRNGMNGIVIQNNAVVVNCTASQNDDYGIAANFGSAVSYSFSLGNRLGGMSLNPTTSFTQNSVLDNFGADPVVFGIDGGGNTCTNSAGTPVGC